MSAPRSDHQATRRRVELVVEREYQPDPARCIAAIIKLLTYRPAATTDTAAPSRPLGAGDQLEQDNTGALPTKGDAGVEEDGHRDAFTTPDA